MEQEYKIVALGGNPNVGKSTVFNTLTGMRQHTGNWPGKTVANAQGRCIYENKIYVLADLPGCYSLMAHSAEEEEARDFICFGQPDAVIMVCDATCLERNLNLVLQTIEMTPHVVVCVNLMDEAAKKKINVDLDRLSERLGVPVIGTAARSGEGLDELMHAVKSVIEAEKKTDAVNIRYPDYIENAIIKLMPCVKQAYGEGVNARWLSLMLLHWDESMHGFIDKNLKTGFINKGCSIPTLKEIKDGFAVKGITDKDIRDDIVASLVGLAEDIWRESVSLGNRDYKSSDIKIDNVLTGKWTAFPIMFLALIGIFWLTITGANYPSRIISDILFKFGEWLHAFFIFIGVPKFIYEMLVLGVYRVLAWVVSVMLPPMALFFPLFTLLEDAGFLPRIAFNLDKCFKRCNACGKQALTMRVGNICCGRKEP